MSVSKEELEELNENFSGENATKLLAAGLLFNTRQNSGSRLIMSSAFIGEQWVIPNNAESPDNYTGFENSFGKYADSITRAEKNYKVIAVIDKFPTKPRHIYLYVVQDVLTGVYDVIDIRHYESYAEAHGHIKPQTDGDLFMPDMIIPEGKILAHAPTIDEYGNYKIGVNANVVLLSSTDVEEDAYCVRRGFAEETTYTQIEKHPKTINKNEILKNIYGDNSNFKSFPDIGEEIENGIICSSRIINYAFAASELTEGSLRSDLDSDYNTAGKGKIIDIDVYVNNEEELMNNSNRNQIMKYWLASKYYHENIVKTLGKIVQDKQNKYTYKLQSIYERSLDFLNPNIQFSSNNGVFDFAFIEFTTAYEAKLIDGSKITDRAASKGVCHIIDDEFMPLDKYGRRADIIKSPPGVVGRANISQLYEPELNFIAFFIRMKIAKATKDGLNKQFAILYDFIEEFDPKQSAFMRATFDHMNDVDRAEYIADIIEHGIKINQVPLFGNITYEQICRLYDKYGVKPDRVRVQREIKKHGFSDNLLMEIKKDYYGAFFNKKGELENHLVTPDELEENRKKALEEWGDDEYLFTDEFIMKSENDHYLVKNEGDKIIQLTKPDDRSLEEIINENWTDETYLVRENKDTVVLSFMTQEPVIIAPQFFVILKHIPEEKLSARFVGSTSALGLPNKTGKTESNNAISGTPIKYGEMELFNALIRVDPLLVYRNLSVMSKNPEMRSEMFKILLFDNPLSYHNLKQPITEVCDDIPAKVFHAYLFCLGLEVMNEKDDIYSVFDEFDLTDEQLDKIVDLHFNMHPLPELVKKAS